MKIEQPIAIKEHKVIICASCPRNIKFKLYSVLDILYLYFP